MPRRIGTFRPSHLPTPQQARADHDSLPHRLEAKRFYASTRWRKLRAAYLSEHPLCADCQATGRIAVAEHLHHIQSRRKHPELAHDWDNLLGLCEPCHSARTAKGE